MIWVVIAATSVIRIVVISRSYFWQDDYIHRWTAWNGELVWQNWNGHREPASFGIQWLLARVAPHEWWPAATVLSVIAVATSVMFWLMLRRWGANPVAGMLFAAWPATLVAQQWLSAGLETVPLVLMFGAGMLLARPARWTPAWVGLLCLLAWTFHERAVYFGPVLFAIAFIYTGRAAWRNNRNSWWVLIVLTAAMLLLRAFDDLPGQTGGTSIPGALWFAGPGGLLRSVFGWLPFSSHTVTPDNVALWGLAVMIVWMGLVIAGLSLAAHRSVVLLLITGAFVVVEVLSFVTLRGGFAGPSLASDPRFTLISGTILIAGLGVFGWPIWTGALAVAGCASMLAYPATPGRDWFTSLPSGVELAATPSPPQMLSHFFFTTTDPPVELGTTRTLLQVGPNPPRFPQVSTNPQEFNGTLRPLRFTPLLTDPRTQCGALEVPPFDAAIRVVALQVSQAGEVNGVRVRPGPVYVFPPPGPVVITAPCTQGIVVGIPGR